LHSRHSHRVQLGDAFNPHILTTVGEVFQERIRRRFQNEGGVGTVDVSTSFEPLPLSRALIQVAFASTPERLDALTAMVLQEAETFRTSGPLEEEVAFVKEQLEEELSEFQETNGCWVNVLQSRVMSGKPFKGFSIQTAEDILRQLDVTSVRSYARHYLNPLRYVQVSQVPK